MAAGTPCTASPYGPREVPVDLFGDGQSLGIALEPLRLHQELQGHDRRQRVHALVGATRPRPPDLRREHHGCKSREEGRHCSRRRWAGDTSHLVQIHEVVWGNAPPGAHRRAHDALDGRGRAVLPAVVVPLHPFVFRPDVPCGLSPSAAARCLDEATLGSCRPSPAEGCPHLPMCTATFRFDLLLSLSSRIGRVCTTGSPLPSPLAFATVRERVAAALPRCGQGLNCTHVDAIARVAARSIRRHAPSLACRLSAGHEISLLRFTQQLPCHVRHGGGGSCAVGVSWLRKAHAWQIDLPDCVHWQHNSSRIHITHTTAHRCIGQRRLRCTAAVGGASAMA